MDFRRSARIPVDFKIDAYLRGRLVLSCKVANISLHGLLLRTDKAPFPKGSPLEIRFSIVINNITEIIYVDARVTRINFDGVGVRFFEDSSGTLIHLQKILQNHFFQPQLNTSIDKC